jgi:hypothetical protein
VVEATPDGILLRPVTAALIKRGRGLAKRKSDGKAGKWELIPRRGAGAQRRIAAKRKRNAKRETDEGLPRWCGPAFLHLFELLAARTVSVPRGLARECLTRSHRPGLATSSSPVPSAGGATEDRPGRKPGFTDPPAARVPAGRQNPAARSERRRDPVGSPFLSSWVLCGEPAPGLGEICVSREAAKDEGGAPVRVCDRSGT